MSKFKNIAEIRQGETNNQRYEVGEGMSYTV